MTENKNNKSSNSRSARIKHASHDETLRRALAANLPHGAAFILDHNLRYILADGQALRSAGFSPDDFEGRSIQDALEPHLRKQYEPHYKQALRGKPFRTEHQSHGRHFISHGTPIRDDDGNVTHVLVASYDITDRKHAEDALRQTQAEQSRQRELFQGIFDNIPVMLVLWEPHLKRFTLNRHTEQLLGWSTDDANNRDFMKLVYPDPEQRARVADFMQSLESAWHEWAPIARSGQPIPSSWTNIRLADETRIGIGVDLRQHKQAENELRKLNESLEQQVAERAGMLKVLSDIATVANQSDTFEDALAYALKRVSQHNGWCFGHAYIVNPQRPDTLIPANSYYADDDDKFSPFRSATRKNPLQTGQGLPGHALQTGKPQFSQDLIHELTTRRAEIGTRLGLKSAAAFPVLVGNEVAAVLEFFADKHFELTNRILEAMGTIGTQLGRVVERERAERNLARALLAEQQRLGRELHDTVGQDMAGLALITEQLANRADHGTAPTSTQLRELSHGLRRALQNTRDVVRDLLPLESPDSTDFMPRLHALADNVTRLYNVPCHVDGPDTPLNTAPDTALHLYRIAAEALINAAKHANPNHIHLQLHHEHGKLVLRVIDDGTGIPDKARGDGSGLWIMRHRANVIGATLEIKRNPKGGTTVTSALPEERLNPTGTEETQNAQDPHAHRR